MLFLLSLWPLLTGPVPSSRRPRLADDFYRSRSLWLQPLLAWVSEVWLPLPAREAAAGFVQRALLPFLHDASSQAPDAGDTSGRGADQGARFRGERDVSEAISPRKETRQVRLVGGKLCAVEENEEEEGRGIGGEGDEFGAEAEEAKILQALKSAANVVTRTTGTVDPSPAPVAPEGPAEDSRVDLGSSAPTNPFVRKASPLPGALGSREPGDSSVASGDGWSSTPWEQRLGAANSSSQLPSSGRASPRSSATQSTRGPHTVPAMSSRSETVSPSSAGVMGIGNQLSAVERSQEEVPNHKTTGRPSAVGDPQGSRNLTHTSSRHRERDSLSSSVQIGSWTGATVATVVAAAKTNSKVGSSGDRDGTRYVTAAEAATSVSRAEEQVSAARPRGSVVERWREMQRKQMGETRAPASAGSEKGSHQVDRRPQVGLPRDATKTIPPPRPEAVASHSAAANAAFAAAARATASRGEAPKGGAQAHEPTARPVDYASLAEASSMELHKLVLSSWTIPELLKAPGTSARVCSFVANEGQERRWLSNLWLPKVRCHPSSSKNCAGKAVWYADSPVCSVALLTGLGVCVAIDTMKRTCTSQPRRHAGLGSRGIVSPTPPLRTVLCCGEWDIFHLVSHRLPR